MGPDLALLVPSRGRPGNIRRLNQSLRDTDSFRTVLKVGVDEDDPYLGHYIDDWEQDGTYHLVMRNDLRRVVPWLNLMSSCLNVETHPYVGTVGDDNVFQTPNWDERVIQSLQTHAFCFGDDEHPFRARGSLACHIFTHTAIVEKLGYFGNPTILHMWIDNTWTSLGHATSMEFLSDVKVPHLHPSAGKAEMDDSYRESEGVVHRDAEAYQRYMNDPRGFHRDVEKIKSVMEDLNERLSQA